MHVGVAYIVGILFLSPVRSFFKDETQHAFGFFRVERSVDHLRGLFYPYCTNMFG
jgi:hypothetical protein